MCKEVLRSSRALLSEFRVKSSGWLAVIRLIQCILNNSFRPRIDNRAPISAFAGSPADNLLRNLLPLAPARLTALYFVQALRILQIKSLMNTLDEIHRNVPEKSIRKRQQEVDRNNKHTRSRSVYFDVCDFVLVADTDPHVGLKLCLKWKGPLLISPCDSPLVYEGPDLLNKSINLIHVSRLNFYALPPHDRNLALHGRS